MREREQFLMDRGNQYKRAIQIFYAENKHYPAKLEDLENTNDKRYLRRRYIDPLTGSDEWRLIHTNGTALTDSLVQKPPTQNAANGTPGVGILPGGGPLGTNNMNAAPDQAAGGQTVPGQTGVPGANGQQPAPVNAAVLRRPSDRLAGMLPNTTPGVVQNSGQDNGLTPGLYPPGYNPASYNPNDPSTWPPISLAPINSQTGQPGQPNVMPGVPGVVNPGALNGQPNFGQPNTAQPNNAQPNTGQANTGQPLSIPGFGGPPSLTAQQPMTQTTTQISSPFGNQAQGVVQTPLPFGPQSGTGGDPFNNAAQQNPAQSQPGVVPDQTTIPGQGPGLGGQNPQIYNPALGFPGNPLAPNVPQAAGAGQPGVVPAQLNPALQTINGQLTSPTAAPAAPLTNAQMANSPQMAPGIAGVASKFDGVGIKIYNKRLKYKEWEFVFDPATTTTTTVPANGQAAGQNGLQNGQGNSGTNPGAFSIPGFGSAPGTSQQPGQQPQSPFNATPSSSPFGQPSNPFGAPTQ